MSTIQFANGQSVQFDGDPTPQDVDFVAKQIGITSDQPPAPAPTNTPLFDRSVPTFNSTGNEGAGMAAAKTAANVIPSAINTGLGLVKMPIEGLSHLKDLPAVALDIMKNQTPLQGMGNILGGIYSTMVPSFLQNLGNAGLNESGISKFLPEGVRSNIAPDTTEEALRKGSQSMQTDPVGQLLPIFMLGRDAAHGVSPEAGAMFDNAVSKIASPVTVPGQGIIDIIGKGKDIVGAGAKQGVSSLTGIPYAGVDELLNKPKDYPKGQSLNRSDITNEVKNSLDQRIQDLSDTGKEYGGIRDMKTIDTAVSPETTKTIKEGGRTLEYNLVDAPDSKLNVPELRKKVQMLESDPSTPGDILHQTTRTLAERELSDTIDHPVKVRPNDLRNIIKSTTGLTIDETGKLQLSPDTNLKPSDVSTLQNRLLNKYQGAFDSGKLTTKQYLNLRSDMADIANYDSSIGKSKPLENLSDVMRGKLNTKYRSQIPGLEKLDTEYGPKAQSLKELRKGIIDKDGNLMTNAESKIFNANNRGRTMVAEQLEKIKPGITRRIQIMRTLEMIEEAKNPNKPGTYGKTLGMGGGLGGVLMMLSGLTTAGLSTIAGAIAEIILSQPDVAVPLLRAYGNSTALIDAVIGKIKDINNLPNTGMTPLIPSSLKKDYKELPMGLSIRDVTKDIPKVYKGETDLTTNILKDLEGKTTVSKQYIMDATNRGELKQVEREITRNVLETIKGDTVNVADFAKKVKEELLPLKVKSSDVINVKAKDHYASNYMVDEGDFSSKYENISLPKELRGNVANYKENIYESPISTSAGDTHFQYNTKNYFGHSRIEDLADNSTRRVIEIQSDLFQKGRLENEGKAIYAGKSNNEIRNILKETNPKQTYTDEAINNFRTRAEEFKKLEPYRNTWHERIIREEVAQAAKDGKTTLQFPTGETAMKIEGLGDVGRDRWIETGAGPNGYGQELKPEALKVGMTVHQDGINKWIITDVLGDGKFKAVPKETADKFKAGKIPQALYETGQESFDISGKVDTSNPIYKFYEKEVGRFLKNKYDAKPVTDDKGVKWMQIDIKPEMGKAPINALGMIKSRGRSLNIG